MQEALIISSCLYSHSNDKDEASSIKMPKLLNQDSYECICFSCCSCVSPAVYMAFIIEGILLKWYPAQELHIYSSSPWLWISLINDVRQHIICQLCKHSFFHTSPDAAIHTIHEALIFCLHLPLSSKEEADEAPKSMGGALQMQTRQRKQEVFQQTRKC